ncbi:MAG: hypothetical protein WAT77_02655, partial [Paracoccaceae bacterium]
MGRIPVAMRRGTMVLDRGAIGARLCRAGRREALWRLVRGRFSVARPTEVHIRTIESALAGSEAARSPLVASWSRSARLHGLDPTKRRRP